MGNIVALVDEDTALGFRLSGVEARPTETPEELVLWAEALLADADARLVLVDEALFRRIPERFRKKLEDSGSPVFVPIPASRLSEGAVKPEEYVARLMRRAIGYQIRIRP